MEADIESDQKPSHLPELFQNSAFSAHNALVVAVMKQRESVHMYCSGGPPEAATYGNYPQICPELLFA